MSLKTFVIVALATTVFGGVLAIAYVEVGGVNIDLDVFSSQDEVEEKDPLEELTKGTSLESGQFIIVYDESAKNVFTSLKVDEDSSVSIRYYPDKEILLVTCDGSRQYYFKNPSSWEIKG